MDLAAIHQFEATRSLGTLEVSVMAAAAARYCEADALGRTVQRLPAGDKIVQPLQLARAIGGCMHQRVE
jgi:hypothetical protein